MTDFDKNGIKFRTVDDDDIIGMVCTNYKCLWRKTCKTAAVGGEPGWYRMETFDHDRDDCYNPEDGKKI